MTKQLKDYKCGEMLCSQCPLRVFGCAIAVDNPKLRRLLICCTTAARIELLGYIDEEEKNEAVKRL